MSVNTEKNRTDEFATNGVGTEFDFFMLIHDKSEIQVFYKATGDNYALLTLNTHYGVVFTDDGGTVSTDGYSAPLAAGKLLIIRHLELTQKTNWLYNDLHIEQQHQDDFDRSVMRDLQIQEQLDRAVGFAIHSSTKDIEFPEPEAGKIIGWNAAGTALENKDPVTALVTLPYGNCYGDHINWTQANAVQNTWYNITDATMTDSGNLNEVSHDDNGLLTVTKAGRYLVCLAVTWLVNKVNNHIDIGIQVDGSGAAVESHAHTESKFANQEQIVTVSCIINLAADATIQAAIRTLDAVANTNFIVDDVNLTCLRIGGA